VIPPLQCVYCHVGLLLLAMRRVRLVGGGGGPTESVTRLVQIFLCALCTKGLLFLLAMNGLLRICKGTDMQRSVAENADILRFLNLRVPCSFSTTLDADPRPAMTSATLVFLLYVEVPANLSFDVRPYCLNTNRCLYRSVYRIVVMARPKSPQCTYTSKNMPINILQLHIITVIMYTM